MNSLRLSPTILAELYPSCLVLLNEPLGDALTGTDEAGETPEPVAVTLPVQPPSTSQQQSAKDLKFLGDNRKNTLVLVEYDNVAYLPDDALGFLTNMLTACKLSLADVAIVNLAAYPHQHYKDLQQELKSSTVFLFGIEPAAFGLPLSFPHFQVQSFSGVTYLFTPALELYKEDKLLKSKLWVSLKKIFQLS